MMRLFERFGLWVGVGLLLIAALGVVASTVQATPQCSGYSIPYPSPPVDPKYRLFDFGEPGDGYRMSFDVTAPTGEAVTDASFVNVRADRIKLACGGKKRDGTPMRMFVMDNGTSIVSQWVRDELPPLKKPDPDAELVPAGVDPLEG